MAIAPLLTHKGKLTNNHNIFHGITMVTGPSIRAAAAAAAGPSIRAARCARREATLINTIYNFSLIYRHCELKLVTTRLLHSFHAAMRKRL